MTIVVVDYGMGNTLSVLNALELLGQSAVLSSDHQAIADASGLILPGVGAFPDAMRVLRERGLDEAMARSVTAGKPFLGICLGMQLIARTGTEHEETTGLGFVAGRVEKLTIPPGDTQLRLPHVGWNTARLTRADGLFQGLGEAADFYFVHSYVLVPEDPGIVAATCEHGSNFAVAVEADNVWATQFHPEKSQKRGLAVLSNWIGTL
jgi:glutamine amidotransferase